MIEFLLDHLYILVILLAAASSLFGKKSRNESDKPAPKKANLPKKAGFPPMPPFGLPPFGGDEFPFPFPGQSAEKKEVPQRAPSVFSQNRPGETVSETDTNEPEIAPLETTFSERKLVFQEKEISPPKAAVGFSKGEFVRGILWAEVLAPPRAKRPFGTKRSKL